MPTEDSNVWKEKSSQLESLTLDDAKFIFEQADKRFSDTIETANRIYERSYTLLTIISGILISLSAYSIDRWDQKKSFDNLELTAISAIGYFLCLGLIFVLKNISPQDYDLPGTTPINYFVPGLFNDKIKKEDRILNLYKVEIINYNSRIQNNEATNNTRWRMYIICLKSLFYSPIILILLYLIFTVTSPNS